MKMKKSNNILNLAIVAIATLGLLATDVMAQGPAPTTSSAFRMYNGSGNSVTIAANPANGGTGTFLWPLPSSGVFTSNASGVMTIRQITAADLNLTFNSMFVGDASGTAAELAAGTVGQVLQIDAVGSPSWETINLLPSGTSPNTTLAWDPTANGGSGAWVENTNLLADPTTGDVTSGPAGSMTINNNDLNVPNLTVTAGPLPATTNIMIVDAAGNVTETSPTNIVGAANLPQDNIYVGNALNNPAPYAPGTPGQVLQIVGTTPTWQSINLLPTGSVNNATLVWDEDANGPGLGAWVENTNVTMDLATGDIATTGDVDAAGDVTVDGNTTIGDGAGDALTIDAGNITANNVPEILTPAFDDENVMVVDPVTGIVSQTSPTSIVGAANLPEDNIYVGDVNNNPAAYAPGNPGEVLQIVGTTPTWNAINLLPDGSVNNATLVWDEDANGPGLGAWVENTNVTMDLATGDIATTGDVDAAGDVTVDGNTTIGDGAGDALTIDAGNITANNVPEILTPAFDDENVMVVDPVTGIVSQTSPTSIVGAANLPQNNIYVGDVNNNPAAYAPGTNGDVLTVVAGTPTWSTPVGTIAAKGKVTGTGTWTYTINPGVDPSGASTVIMVSVQSSAGLQVTHVVNNVGVASFDVEFPVNIGGTETIHWTVIQ